MQKRASWRLDFESDAFWRQFPFKWNGAFWEKWRRFIHLKGRRRRRRRRSKNDAVLNGTICLLLPMDSRGMGRRWLSPLLFLFYLSLSLKPQKDTDTTSPLAFHVVEEWRGRTPWAVRGGCIVAAHASLSPVFPINTREESKKKKNKEEGGRQNRRGKELKIERKKKRKTEEEKKRKTQRSRGKKRERSPLGATAISPPGFPATASHHFCHRKPLQTTVNKLLHSR